jgi:hypothetical protein
MNDELRPAGFHRKGASWYLRGKEIVAVLNLQKSQYGDRYFLNIGFLLMDLDDNPFPREEQCHVRTRAAQLWSEDRPGIEDMLDMEYPFSAEPERISSIRLFVQERLIPLLREGSQAEGLSQIVKTRPGFLVHRDARKRLGYSP